MFVLCTDAKIRNHRNTVWSFDNESTHCSDFACLNLFIAWHVACSYNLFKYRRFVTQNMKFQHKIHEEMFRTEGQFIPPISRLVIYIFVQIYQEWSTWRHWQHWVCKPQDEDKQNT